MEKKKISPNNPNQTENQGGRPPKLNEKFLKVVEKVLNDNINSIILTDEELFELINMELEDKDKIGYTTFKDYKAKKGNIESELYDRFSALYKKAITIQKKSLFESLKSDPQSWQRYAWIIERKFNEWNLKSIQENTTKLQVDITQEGSILLDELNN